MDLNVDQDELMKVARTRVVNLNKVWLNVKPLKQDFSSLITGCFQEGLECLKHFERWSRHEDLLKYVKVLESWDDKVNALEVIECFTGFTLVNDISLCQQQ